MSIADKSRFAKVEVMLYAYKGALESVKVKEEALEELKKYGLPHFSPSYVGTNNDKNRQDALEEEVERLERSISFLARTIRLIESGLSVIKGDEYFELIKLKYFENKTMEDIAEHMNTGLTTIYRNRERLIYKLIKIIFAEDILRDILERGGVAGDNCSRIHNSNGSIHSSKTI
jgi:hypothetical protein